MVKTTAPIKPPSLREKQALRLMIVVGVISVVFFLYSLFQKSNISYFPLYVLLMITMLYYCLKYLHEWYHYFSISAPVKPETNKIYTVDILTTYCAGEPFDMLEQTLTAIQAITYPHTAWCCDEADDPDVKALCMRLGVKHVTRVIKKNAKAGNINNALQYATGELCVVLDPDHIPVPEFLDRVVAYFDDETIGYVQVVQAYYNQTESLVAKGAAQQTYQFYGPMMMGMNSYNTVQAIGANCTFRRTALDSIGGHAAGLSEDMHTAMQMHAKGWRSVYVPEILTRGLVPATLSSYFKQQLKWSRGTWELLLVTYPRLFSKFNLRQKIHYGLLPFHYLSGFIFLINFLIPVISLFTGYIPLRMDVVSFMLAAFPLFAMSILIRHYVQKWVAEESDRGFHLVGGILQIGAWWIFSVGVVYTFFRKKVPYIPTPKNDNEPLPFLLNLPNLFIAVVSAGSIAYGLMYDYTPYTIFMVALASLQIFFMLFIFAVSGYTNNLQKVNNLMVKVRDNTWLIEKAHGFLRRFSVPLSLLVIVLFIFGYVQQQKLPTFLPKELPGTQVFYRGIHQQSQLQSDFKAKKIVTEASGKDIAIMSFDLPWGQGEANNLDTSFLRNIYNQQKIPMLRWQLWQYDSASGSYADKAVLNNIVNGKYDSAVRSLAKQVARLRMPIFLSCSNNPVNNKLPLFAKQDSSNATDVIAAWQHIHQLFDNEGAAKVIWVWSLSDTASSKNYPGSRYADWLAVNLPSAKPAAGSVISSFDSLYRPFHKLQLFDIGIPVMIFQNNSSVAGNRAWWNAAWQNIDTAFKEIKSMVIVTGSGQTPGMLQTNFATAPRPSLPLFGAVAGSSAYAVTKEYKPALAVKSVVYDKGYYWFRNRHTMSLKTIEADVAEMKTLGINTIERRMPGLYDSKLRKVLEANQVNLIPRFWLPATPEVVADDRQLLQQKKNILEVVKENLHKKYVVGWNLGEDALFNLGNQLYKPDYFYYQQKYVAWLADVCREIKLLDSTRPLMMDLQWDQKGRERFAYYKKQLPLIDKFMLVADAKYKQGLKEPLEPAMAWGKVSVDMWPLLDADVQSLTIPAWQDLENTDFITLNGLLDMHGRRKDSYHVVEGEWTGKKVAPSPIPEIRILKPAKVTREYSSILYRLIYRKTNTRWVMYEPKDKNIQFEWYLVRTDQYGNSMYIKRVGEGIALNLTIPLEPQYYRLYVEAVSGKDVKMINSTLNIPLE